MKLVRVYRREFSWEVSEHEGNITILMFTTVGISSVLQKQSAHACFALIDRMHERGHVILKRHQGKYFRNVFSSTQKFSLAHSLHKLWKSSKCVCRMEILTKHCRHLLRVTWAGWVIIFIAPRKTSKDCVGGTANKLHIWFWQVGYTYQLLFLIILAPKGPQVVCRLHLVACLHYHTSLRTTSSTQESPPYAWITMQSICCHQPLHLFT